MLTRQRLIALTTALLGVGACSAGCSTPRARTEAVATRPKCSDLSGKYVNQGEDGQVHISIEQERCDRVTIRRENNYLGTITSEKHVLKLDGKVQEDSPSPDRHKWGPAWRPTCCKTPEMKL